jgi:hypothetical protein
MGWWIIARGDERRLRDRAQAILDIAMIGVVIAAWFVIVFTGRYPRTLFGFSEGVIRSHERVIAYALTLVTDEYPPFRLR